ncbi:hypothetical protein JCM6882_008887 [Rhodosporidiobolus microsporus]
MDASSTRSDTLQTPRQEIPSAEGENTTPSAPPNASQLWTADDDAQVARLRSEGVDFIEIGRRLGRSRAAVSARLSYVRELAKKASARADEDGNERPNIEVPPVAKVMRQFTPEEDAQLIALFKAGKTQQAVGKALGRAQSSVGGRKLLLQQSGEYGRPTAGAAASPAFSTTPAPSAGLSTSPFPALPALPPSKLPWSKADDALLRSLVQQQASWPVVAVKLGREEKRCRKRWEERKERWANEGLLPMGDIPQATPSSSSPPSSPSRAPSAAPLPAPLAGPSPSPLHTTLSTSSLAPTASPFLPPTKPGSVPPPPPPGQTIARPDPFRLSARAREAMKAFVADVEGALNPSPPPSASHRPSRRSPTDPRGALYTRADDALILRLRREGKTGKEIAQRLGRTEGSLSGHWARVKRGVEGGGKGKGGRRKREAARERGSEGVSEEEEDGGKQEESGDEGCDYSSPRSSSYPTHRRYSPSEDALLLHLRKVEGLTWPAVAVKLSSGKAARGRTANSVAGRYAALMKRRGRGKRAKGKGKGDGQEEEEKEEEEEKPAKKRRKRGHVAMSGLGGPSAPPTNATGLRSPPQTPQLEDQRALFDLAFEGIDGLEGPAGGLGEWDGQLANAGGAAMDIDSGVSGGVEGFGWTSDANLPVSTLFATDSYFNPPPPRASTSTAAALPPFRTASTTLPDWLDPQLSAGSSSAFTAHSPSFHDTLAPRVAPPYVPQPPPRPAPQAHAPVASTSSGSGSATAAPSPAALTRPVPAYQVQPFDSAETDALVALVAQYGRKWTHIGRELVAKGFPQRKAKSLRVKYEAVRAQQSQGQQRQQVGSEDEAPDDASTLPNQTERKGWTSSDDAKLLHLADSLQRNATNADSRIDWTAALPFFPGKTAQQLSARLSRLKAKRRAAKAKEESERLTREALQAFQAGQGGGGGSKVAQPQNLPSSAPPSSNPAPDPSALVAPAFPTSTSREPSATPSASTPVSRLSFTFQGRPITSLQPTDVAPPPSSGVAPVAFVPPRSYRRATNPAPASAVSSPRTSTADPTPAFDFPPPPPSFTPPTAPSSLSPPAPSAPLSPLPAPRTSTYLRASDPPRFPRRRERHYPFYWPSGSVVRNLKRLEREAEKGCVWAEEDGWPWSDSSKEGEGGGKGT